MATPPPTRAPGGALPIARPLYSAGSGEPGDLFAGGWICASWPTEYGGKGLTLFQQVVLNEEFARIGHEGQSTVLPGARGAWANFPVNNLQSHFFFSRS
jgi:hypothetical protein